MPQIEIKYELKTKFANLKKKKAKPKTQQKKQLNRRENLHAMYET